MRTTRRDAYRSTVRVVLLGLTLQVGHEEVPVPLLPAGAHRHSPPPPMVLREGRECRAALAYRVVGDDVEGLKAMDVWWKEGAQVASREVFLGDCGRRRTAWPGFLEPLRARSTGHPLGRKHHLVGPVRSEGSCRAGIRLRNQKAAAPSSVSGASAANVPPSRAVCGRGTEPAHSVPCPSPPRPLNRIPRVPLAAGTKPGRHDHEAPCSGRAVGMSQPA